MFVLNPNEFLLPYFGMTPFRTEDVAKNHNLQENLFSVTYLNNRFGVKNWELTYNGREAIQFALNHYNLNKDDVVTIFTSSDNFYISSCVTLEIDRVCKWNRVLVPETKVIFVNHEFGFPYPKMEYLVSLGIPIIEDCCTTFFSQDRSDAVGKYGEFAVYSLPKIFPLQIGGIIVSNKFAVEKQSILTFQETQYITNVLSCNLQKADEIIGKRRTNYKYAVNLFRKLGFSERFSANKKIIPYALLLNNNGLIKNLNTFKAFLNKNGIQNSTFYGEDGFFIPNHQGLELIEIEFIYQLFCFYLENSNK